MKVAFKNGVERSFDLVLGCDGSHSGVRKLWFGPEQDYEHFLQAYFSITIVNKLLIKQKTMQMYNVPDKGFMLTIIKPILSFASIRKSRSLTIIAILIGNGKSY